MMKRNQLYLPQSFKNWVWLLFLLSLITPGNDSTAVTSADEEVLSLYNQSTGLEC